MTLDELMDLEHQDLLEPKDIARIGNLKHNAARTILNTQVRVDEQRLRRRTSDALPKILAVIAEEKQRRAARVIEGRVAATPQIDGMGNTV